MAMISPHDSEQIELLRKELGLSDKATIKRESTLSGSYPIRFDLIIEDGGKTYLVELKRVVRLEDLSRLGWIKLLLNANKTSVHDIEFVIAGKRITNEAAIAAKETGMRFIKLAANMSMKDAHDKSSAMPVKLTSPKSWQVISYLLKTKEASIRQLAIGSGVSYGWTHATVQALASKGIVSDAKGYKKLTDVNKLLNGIAWERPFEKLFVQEMKIAADSAIALTKEICLVCDEQQIPCAFTSFTAGEIYTGYSARHDSVYLYLGKKKIGELSEMFDVQAKMGIAVRIYEPDRDVFKERRTYSTAEKIWLVSPAQALLDCAGLGYAGRDITQKLTEVYDRL